MVTTPPLPRRPATAPIAPVRASATSYAAFGPLTDHDRVDRCLEGETMPGDFDDEAVTQPMSPIAPRFDRAGTNPREADFIGDTVGDSVLDLLSDWNRRAQGAQWNPAREARRLEKFHWLLGIPVVVLTSIVGTSVFAALGKQVSLSA